METVTVEIPELLCGVKKFSKKAREHFKQEARVRRHRNPSVQSVNSGAKRSWEWT